MREKSLSKNFIIYFIRTLVIGVIPLIVHKYAFMTLGKTGTGSVKYIMSIATYFQLFATFGISSYAIREGAKIRDNKRKLDTFVAEMLIFNFVTLSIALLAYLITFIIPKFDNYTTLLFIFLFFVLFSGLTLDWFFNVYEEYVYITIRTCISQILAVVILFAFLKPDRNFVYAIALVFPFFGIFIANSIGIIKRTNFKAIDRPQIKKHILPVCAMFAIVIASSIYSVLDTSMLGWINGDESVGFYSAASELTKLSIKLITAVCAVFVPRLSYYIGIGEVKKFRDLAVRAINIVVLFAVPIAFGLFVFSNQAIVLFSSADFLPASFTMKILAVNLFFSAIDGILGWQVLVPNKREKVLCIATFIGATVDFIVNLILIPVMDYEGAAIATLISELSVFVICILEARKYITIKPVLNHTTKCIIAALPIILVGILTVSLKLDALKTFIVAIPLSGLFYIVILWIIRDELVTSLKDFLANRGSH